jgi:hypothetical protein
VEIEEWHPPKAEPVESTSPRKDRSAVMVTLFLLVVFVATLAFLNWQDHKVSPPAIRNTVTTAQ